MPMSRFNDTPPDPQTTTGAQADSALDSDVLPTVDSVADSMAQKAGKTEKTNESSDTIGGVRSNSGGIFSK